ncbi:MAG: SulP family inorganic anion transporter [Bacteroidota bacterium]
MFKHLNKDLPASVVVFFVALPLCLGIALASGAPLFSGLIAGIVGGIVVGAISKSQLGVSGPAAGLAVIVLSAIESLGSFESFLLAVVIAGVLQILLGVFKAGVIGYFFPNSVIKGMLAGIGIIIIIKQIPIALGINEEFDYLDFTEANVASVKQEYSEILGSLSPGAILITLISLLIIVFWSRILEKKSKIFKIIPGSLVVVILGIIYKLFVPSTSTLSISDQNLVQVPVASNATEFFQQFTLPNFSVITNPEIWVIAFTIAIVASLETLLSVEATDKLDPEKRVTPNNRELVAQGSGNLISGLIGGLPITQVIVRSSANIQSDAKTKLSAIIHGFLLLISVISLPQVLNLIPLSVLAAILLVVGYNLTKPSTIKEIIKQGVFQYVPFFVTTLGIVIFDLLVGIGLGLVTGLLFVLYKSYTNSHFLHKIKKSENELDVININMAEEVTFFNKGALTRELNNISEEATVIIDFKNTVFLDRDIIEVIENFALNSDSKKIKIELRKGDKVETDISKIRNFLDQITR